MNLLEDLKQYRNFIPYENLIKVIKTPLSLCNEGVIKMIPSIKMGSDGPVLANLFFITDHFIIDINVLTKDEIFDYVAINTLENYRFNLSELIIKGADEKEISYQVANIQLLHSLSHVYKTELNYVGNEREPWLKLVTESLPISLILL